jgi:proteasome lid subunit RPN8/RPN11
MLEMNDRIKKEIEAHSYESLPLECVGLVSFRGNRPTAIRMDNISNFPESNFMVDMKKFLELKRLGEIVAIYHSHAKTGHEFSDMDKIYAENLDLPLWVYSCATKRFNVYAPTGYEYPLEGRPFAFGIMDCYVLVKDYYKRVLKIDIFSGEDVNRTSTDDVVLNNIVELNFGRSDFERVKDLKKHDVIAIKGDYKNISHFGIYVGDNMMLHHPIKMLSCKTMYGGAWRKGTAFWARHKSFL